MILDVHCHAGTGDGLTGPWDTSAPLDRYLQRADAAGITHTVVFAPFHSDYRVANREVARIVARHPGRLSGFVFIHPERDRGRVHAMATEMIRRHGFRGIKVHRHDGRLSREICDAARQLEVPILYDPMGEISTVDLVATEYPTVRFIIPHLSSFADDWRAQRGFIAQLVRFPNVFTDTSGVRRFDLLEEAVRRAGPHKVLFGTDGPWLHPAVELAKVRALGLRPEAERLILCGNARRLLRRGAGAPAERSLARVRSRAEGATPDGRDPWLPADGSGAVFAG